MPELKKKIDLKHIVGELIDADENYAKTMIKLFPLELEYQLRLDQILLSSQRANQFQREAEARQTVMQEPIYTSYQEAKLEAKLAYTRLDTLKQVSRAIQSVAWNDIN